MFGKMQNFFLTILSGVLGKKDSKGSSANNETRSGFFDLIKEFRIHEVKAAYVSNAPYKIVFDSGFFREENKKSSLTLDAETAARHGIPISLDLVNRTIICSFQSCELLLDEGKHIDWRTVRDDDVVVGSLKREEKISVNYFQLPPGKNERVSRTLELTTHQPGMGRYASVPCPFYHLFIELTEEEYEECKKLPANTVFQASFFLKAVEVSESGEQGAS